MNLYINRNTSKLKIVSSTDASTVTFSDDEDDDNKGNDLIFKSRKGIV